MPYYNRRYNNRRFNKRRYPNRRFNRRRNTNTSVSHQINYAAMASQALSTAKWVASMINVEKKLHDVALDEGQTGTGNVYLLNGVAQGDTTVSRDGNSIKMHDIDLNFIAEKNPSATYSHMRIMILMDKQTDSTTPTITDVLETSTVNSHRNIDYTRRFYMYYDRVITVDNDKPSIEWKKHIKTQAHVRYSGAGNSITAISSAPIFLMVLSTELTDAPTLIAKSRLRYIDN